MKSEYNGQCAFGFSLGKNVAGLEKFKLEKDGKTYLFSNPIAKLLWKILPGRKAKADTLWQKS